MFSGPKASRRRLAGAGGGRFRLSYPSLLYAKVLCIPFLSCVARAVRSRRRCVAVCGVRSVGPSLLTSNVMSSLAVTSSTLRAPSSLPASLSPSAWHARLAAPRLQL
ncbi:hypothetical protein BDW02DRAFT_227380 [Decorospora gaudefroyi]|uniref:Uncharacterized protein n=1 Tax=Decorospora gaudefroyi TaxID=184978 RepID=A0A6A5K2P8_9PLEO|nr:hypothetical protein BDW02DRAFT_227380 [Decorospora gaudefroyi]